MTSRERSAEADAAARAVIGAAIEVHRHLGPGFLESICEEALAVEFDLRDIPYQQQAPVAVDYKGHPVGQARLDLVVAERVLVELKTVEARAPIHVAQVIPYLKTTGLELGLLINSNVPVLKEGIRRIVLS